MNHSYFANKLKSARQSQNMTLEELAQRVKRSKSYLSLLENGVRNPSSDLARELAKALNQNADDWAFTIEIPNMEKIQNEFPGLFYRYTKSQNSLYDKLKKSSVKDEHGK